MALFLLLAEVISNHQDIHLCPLETVDCFGRSTDDWFVLIETCVKYDRYSGDPIKGLDQLMVSRICFATDCLKSSSVIHVVDRADRLAHFRACLVNHEHGG